MVWSQWASAKWPRLPPAHLALDHLPPARPVRGRPWKPTVPRTAPTPPPPSAYLHRRGVCKWLRDGPFTVLGRASLCSLALIAAGLLRAAGWVRGREAPAQRRRRRP